MLNTSTRTNQVVDFVADAFESEGKNNEGQPGLSRRLLWLFCFSDENAIIQNIQRVYF